MLHTLELMQNFDFYVCLRIKFHKLSFWVLILAAGDPYWVLISQKNVSLLGSYLKAWGSLLVWEAVKLLQVKTWIDVQKIKYVVENSFKLMSSTASDACNESNPRIIDDSRARKLANDLKR